MTVPDCSVRVKGYARSMNDLPVDRLLLIAILVILCLHTWNVI